MAKEEKKDKIETVASNRKARHDYFITDTYEAGLALEGPEVKSLRLKQATLTSAFARADKGGLYLHGLHIAPYAYNTLTEIDPVRTRKLLLHSKELARLFSSTSQKGYTCIATAMYWKGNKIKCEIALAKGKQQHDKRATERDRDWDRQKERLKRHA